jgi:antitoxin component of MazEF toxin-antitoxin module
MWLTSWDIHRYTSGVKVLKVRRVGNSNVVALPRELEALGYTPGATVLIEHLEDGSLRVIPTTQLRDVIREIGRQVIEEDREALNILAEHDQAAGDARHAIAGS